MKKTTKSLALLLSLVMLLSVVSVPAMADDVPATTIQPLDDVNIGRGATPGINAATVNKIRLFNKDGSTSWSYTAIGAFAYDVSGVFATLAQNPDYVVDSVKFVPTATKDEGDTTSMTLEFCPISVKWSSSDKEGYTTITTDNRGTIIPFSGTGTEFTAETLSLECKTNPISGQFDITPLFKKHMTNNQGTDLQDFFSFALKMKDTNGGNEAQDIKSSESGDGAEIVVTYVKPEPLSLTDAKLPANSTDNVVLTYNNHIKSVAAKINDVAIDAQYISIDGNTVTINNALFERCNIVEVSVIDEYDNPMSDTYAFTTNKDSGARSMLKVDYNSDSAAATVYYISQEHANHPVTVSLVDTSALPEYCCYSDGLTTNSAGILIHDIPMQLDKEKSYTVYVTPDGGEKSQADVINEGYLDFLWTLATQSTDAGKITERFDIICSTFGLTVGYSDKIDDIGDFYDKLAGREYLLDYQIEEPEDLKQAFEEIGLFTATENITELTAPSDARELYDAMLAKIADRSFADKLAEVEAQCSSDGSPFFVDVYDEFIGASKTINSYADFEEVLKTSYNTKKTAVLLGKFASMTHLSQVGALLTDSETIDAFGIQSLVDRYNALNSTSVVDNALYKKTFADNSDFISVLSSALTSSERVDPPAPQKPSSSPSKGGSAIVGAIGVPVDTTPIVNNENISYKDLAGYDWAKQHIAALSAEGIINGKGNGEFDPAGKVLREEAVKMIVEAFDITASGDAAFDDVSSTDWFRGFVLTAKNAGIVNGVSATSFGAGLSITRQDAAVMLFTALSKKGLASAAASASSFADDADIAAYARDAVAYMNSVGAITGYADGTFKPSSTITRAEFAVVLGRIYNTLN